MSELYTLAIPAFFCVLLFFDGMHILWYGILAAAIHELGHIAVYLLFYKKLPRLRLDWRGAALYTGIANLQKEALLLAAGPGANLLAAILTYLVLMQKASFGGWLFACENIAMALFNLLPISFLDGGRLLALCFALPHQKAAKVLSAGVLAALGVCCFSLSETPFSGAMTALLVLAMLYKLLREE